MPEPPTQTTPAPSQIELAVTWFLVARAMLAARRDDEADVGSAAGLYGQAILGFSESTCLEAKTAERIGSMTLIDALARIKRLPRATQEKLIVGVMMLAFADGQMQPLEIRWASSLASACEMSDTEFQQCCSSARVMAAMLHPAPPTVEEGGA